jgi:hypothetical protein
MRPARRRFICAGAIEAAAADWQAADGQHLTDTVAFAGTGAASTRHDANLAVSPNEPRLSRN